ncbi:hypothetical protein FHX74_001664 [Friedmanniella endophytica]|uniref:Phosphotransferase enzyme family protein n=1 Tax=Microlunatus kandeliicorticis TaxID=1759536 RepID=A0A7W3IRQ9_9ACTN|nr:hypothetical protein [Microlunatus kandeliicorticis]MBA8794059.1 hypothetical protein [Microlunatus kandeliicorticis]
MNSDDRSEGADGPRSPSDPDVARVAAINRKAGTRYVATGRASTGTLGGGVLIDLGDGRTGVVTRFHGPRAHADQTAAIANQLRQQGLPIAAHRRVVELEDSIYFVQERLPGLPPPRIPSVDALQAIVAANDAFRDALADRTDVPLLPMCLVPDHDPVTARHDQIAAHSRATRRVLEHIHALGHHPEDGLGNDAFHIDLTPSNILMSDGTVSGIVDWNLGIYRGDRDRALVKLCFELEREPVSQDRESAVRYLDQILAERVPPETLRRYWASRLVYELHWAVQTGADKAVEAMLGIVDERVVL